MSTFNEMAEEWMRENFPTTEPPRITADDPAEWRLPFACWLATICIRHSRFFTNVVSLYCAFSEWQTEHGDWAPELAVFESLLTERDFLIGDVDGVRLVSDLAFRDDVEACD